MRKITKKLKKVSDEVYVDARVKGKIRTQMFGVECPTCEREIDFEVTELEEKFPSDQEALRLAQDAFDELLESKKSKEEHSRKTDKCADCKDCK